jgi:hypothetical protein
MQTMNLKCFGLESISHEDSIEIAGGHDGIAYKAGHALGQAVKFVGTVFGVVVIFLMPKS